MTTVNTTSTPSTSTSTSTDTRLSTRAPGEGGATPTPGQATGHAAIPAPRQPLDTVPDTETERGAGEPHADDQQGEHVHDVDPDQISYASLYTVTAATRPGGAARGNLAVLIRYWTRGEGRARIRWGSGGDFIRCVRQLSKYVPVNQVHGFCARLHRIATGSWPGPGRRH